MQQERIDRERMEDMRRGGRQNSEYWLNERDRRSGNRNDRNGRGNRTPARVLLIGAGIAAAAFGMMQANKRSGSMKEQRERSRSDMGRAQGPSSLDARRETLVTWLNDAHAMEKSVEQSLRSHAADAKRHPHIHTRMQQHLEETRRHAEMVKERIEALGGSVSSLKSGFSTALGVAQGMASMPMKDSLIKDLLADSAAEQLEISSYKSIITAAELIGDSETAQVARQILRDEEEMLRWLEQQLPQATRTELAKA